MRRSAPPSAEIQRQIELLLAEGVPATDVEGALCSWPTSGRS